MAYLTFAEYTALGYNVVTNATFPRYERKARMRIDDETQSRLVDNAEQSENVKYCVAELIELYAWNDAITAGKVVTGVSNDGVSESYSAFGAAELKAAEHDICVQNLQYETTDDGTPVLWRGVECG